MVAGSSASVRSVQLLHEADALFELSESKRREARNYQAAVASEEGLAGLLRPLSEMGWTLLEDRRWPGSKRANVDFLLIGPGGIVVVDAKSWAEVEIRDGQLFRGDSPEHDEIAKLDSLAERVADAISHTGFTITAITTAIVFTNHAIEPTRVGTVNVLGQEHVAAWLATLRTRLEPHQVMIMAAEVEVACPEMPSAAEVKRPLTPRPRARPDDVEQSTLIDVDGLTQSLVDTALAGPIETWMTFLHPDQNKLIRSKWSGPARVRGPAGTGKTVVGLHRAVYLAERSTRPILFVSFVKTLPVVLASLARRLSPTGADNIDFIGVHRLAHRVLEATGRSVKLSPPEAAAAFNQAWRQTEAAKLLGQIDERSAYWREEIDHVIKGRGLTDFTDYQELSRVGRKTRLGATERGYVWDLFVAYQNNLEARRVHDFNDLLIEARQAVSDFPDLFQYDGVIVDEVQDLNLAGLTFLAELADTAPHSMLLVGDGQQSVYPGGFNLTEAGISVTGRASVLRINYRNTYEIVSAAAQHVAQDTFDDLDGVPVPGARDADVHRHGHQPVVVEAGNRAELEARLVKQLHRTVEALGVPWGDMAVLLLHRKDVDHYRRVLTKAGVPTVELTEYDGVTTDRVKIGTIKRSKGLEFKYVLMPELNHGDPAMWPGETGDSYAERCARTRRELYVGMTRARDGLWLGYLPQHNQRGET